MASTPNTRVFSWEKKRIIIIVVVVVVVVVVIIIIIIIIIITRIKIWQWVFIGLPLRSFKASTSFMSVCLSVCFSFLSSV
jgi:hypothetical protein